jgi:hypothetical protein
MKWSPQAEALPLDPSNRRSEDRYGVEGEVCFIFDDPVQREVTGQLKDYSRKGFRAVHDYPALTSGQKVKFRHLLAGGEAQVVWNRIQEGLIETGFVVLRIRKRG